MSDRELAMSTYADAARRSPDKAREEGAWAVWLLARRCAYEDAARKVERGYKCPGCGTANHQALIAQGMLDAAELLRCDHVDDTMWEAIVAIEKQAERIRAAAENSGVAGEPEATSSKGSEIDSPVPPTQDPVSIPDQGSAVNTAGGVTVPDEAVEAARARWAEMWGDGQIDRAAEQMIDDVLAAAVPHIAAQALRDYADSEHPGPEAVIRQVNYGTGVEHDTDCIGCGASWIDEEGGCTERQALLRRADELERGGDR